MKTKVVKFIKNHPLIAHEVGETALVTAESAEKFIEAGYAQDGNEKDLPEDAKKLAQGAGKQTAVAATGTQTATA